MCSHFNIEDGGKWATFWHIMLYYFKKGKNTTEMQKICAVYEEVAEMIEHVKSGLWSFMLEISLWTMLHGQVDQLKLNSDQIKTLVENNQCYTMREIADILKISKSIKLLVKMKTVSFMEKINELFGPPSKEAAINTFASTHSGLSQDSARYLASHLSIVCRLLSGTFFPRPGLLSRPPIFFSWAREGCFESELVFHVLKLDQVKWFFSWWCQKVLHIFPTHLVPSVIKTMFVAGSNYIFWW